MVAVTRLSAAFSQTPRQMIAKRGSRPSARRSAQPAAPAPFVTSAATAPSFRAPSDRTAAQLRLAGGGGGGLNPGATWLAVPEATYQLISMAQIRAPGT